MWYNVPLLYPQSIAAQWLQRFGAHPYIGYDLLGCAGPMVIAAGLIGSAELPCFLERGGMVPGLRAKPPFLLAGEGVPKQNAKSGWVPYIAPPGVEGYGSRRRRATPRPGRRPTYKSPSTTQFSYKVYTISYYAPGLRWFRGEGQQAKLRKSPG